MDNQEATDKWALTVENARAFLDFAIVNNIPRDVLREHPFCIEILKKALASDRFFVQVFLDSYYATTTDQRNKYWDVVEDDTIPYGLLVCWRGFGKTTGGNGKAIKNICYQLDTFILVISKTHDEASRITENVKLELMCNRRIRAVFGNFKNNIRNAKDVEGMEDVDFELMFSRKGWFACDPDTGQPTCFVMPKGCEQQVRGLSVYVLGRLWRPTLIIVDDLEDRELLASERNRERIRNWFFDDLMPVVSQERPVASGPNAGRWVLKPGQRPPFRVLYLDTYKHEDSLVTTLIDSSKWRSKIFPQSEIRVDADGKRRFYSLAPELISDEQVRVEVRDAIKRNKMDGYAREYMCCPFNPISTAWTKDLHVHYKESDAKLNSRMEVTRFVIWDPARSLQEDSCETAGLAFGVSTSEHFIWLRKEINEKMSVADQPGAAIELCMETGSRILFIEVDGADDWILQDFKDEVSRRGAPIQVIPIYARKKTVDIEYGTGKDARKRSDAKGALRYYKTKQIVHEESMKGGPLEQAQLSWPNPKKWDSLDCLGHFKRACDTINLFFQIQITAESPRFEEDERFLKDMNKRLRQFNRSGRTGHQNPSDYLRMVS